MCVGRINMISPDTTKDIDYAKANWGSFTPNLFYPISSSSSIILKDFNRCSYVYSCYRLKALKEKLVECNSIYFKVHQFLTLKKSVVAGFIISPTLPKDYFVRYTPFAIVASNKSISNEDIKNSERRVLFSHSSFEIIWFSCGVEVISDIWQRMGITSCGEK